MPTGRLCDIAAPPRLISRARLNPRAGLIARARNRTAALLAMVLLTTAGCTSSPDEKPLLRAVEKPSRPASLLKTVQDRGTVRIGVKFDVPLFGLRDPANATLSGFDIEMSREIARRLFPGEGDPLTRIDFVEAISKNREVFLRDGTVDLVLSTYTINAARKELVDFAGPYYIAGQDILARRVDIESGRIRGVADVNGKRVCSVTGSTSLSNLRIAAPKADTSVTKDKYSECFEALRDGTVDAMSTDDVILLGLSQGSPEFALTGNPFHTEPYGIGIPKGGTEMREFINDSLQELFDDGTWTRVYESTIGATGAQAPSPPLLDRYLDPP